MNHDTMGNMDTDMNMNIPASMNHAYSLSLPMSRNGSGTA
jgi:hypothetical protein